MFPKKFKEPVFIFNGAFLIVFIWMNLLANRFSERAQKFPKFVLGIGILALTFWMVAYLIFPGLLKFIEAQAEKEEESAGNRSRYYGAWLCIAGSILMGYLFGFIFVVPTAFLGYGLIPGEKKMVSPDRPHAGHDGLLLHRFLSDLAYSCLEGRRSGHRLRRGCNRTEGRSFLMVPFGIIYQGIAGTFTLENLLLLLLGLVVGVVVGILPGIGPAAGMVLVLPFSVSLQASSALILMSGVYFASSYGGSVAAILVNTPGESASAATLLDGYPMTQRGRGAEALGISATAGCLGAVFGLLVLAFTAPLLASLALRFGPAENCLLALFALSVISAIVKRNPMKGFISRPASGSFWQRSERIR